MIYYCMIVHIKLYMTSLLNTYTTQFILIPLPPPLPPPSLPPLPHLYPPHPPPPHPLPPPPPPRMMMILNIELVNRPTFYRVTVQHRTVLSPYHTHTHTHTHTYTHTHTHTEPAYDNDL